jgi:hypothetical protein
MSTSVPVFAVAARLRIGAIATVLAVLGLLPAVMRAQGCVPARHFALSLGPDGVVYLNTGEWIVGASYRYLYADEGWLGTHSWPAYATVVGNQITVHSVDVQATYAFNSRLSVTATVPFVHGKTSNPREHDGTRRDVTASGLGDMRVVVNRWLFEPETHPDWNIAIGLGLKFPTGNENAKATFYKPTGPQVLPVDISIQPGDGGLGVILELSAFRRVAPRLHAYANGFYLVNPREQNKAFAHAPIQGQIRNLSVPDQYQARAGLSWEAAPESGLALSLGLRFDGVPAHDRIGGSEGFRRPGYVLYADPGLTWSDGRNTLNLHVPVRLDANRTRNVYDIRAGTDGGGAFASHLIVTSFSRRF